MMPTTTSPVWTTSKYYRPAYSFSYTKYVPLYRNDCPYTSTDDKNRHCLLGYKTEEATQNVPPQNSDTVSLTTNVYTATTGFQTKTTTTNTVTNNSNPPEKSGEESSYTLDSRGNRLYVKAQSFGLTSQDTRTNVTSSKTAYDGYIKRYNAEDQVVMFYNYASGYKSAYSDFVYDPKGNMVLSSSASVSQDTAVQKLVLNRDYSTTYHSNGEVQVIRKRWGTHRDTVDTTATGEKQVVSNATFSMADGVNSDRTWNAIVLFDVPQEGIAPLEAPVEALSTTLQIDPMEIVAPTDETPALPGDEEIAPPVDEVEQPEEGEQAGSNNTGITTLLEGESLGSTTALVETQEVDTQDTGLATPTEGLLPESITSLDATSVVAPEGYSFDTPTGEVTEITQPNSDTSVPQVGTTAADSPTDIIMPEDIAGSDLPDVGDVPAPIETVVPPIGWSPADEVAAFEEGKIEIINGMECTRGVGGYYCDGTPTNLSADQQKRLEELKATLGDAVDGLIEELEKDLLSGFGRHSRDAGYIKNWLARQLGVDPDQLGLNDNDLAFTAATFMVGNFILMTADSGPAVQIELLKSYKVQIADGAMDAFGFKDLVDEMATKPFYNQEYTPTSIAMGHLSSMYQTDALLASCSGSQVSSMGGPPGNQHSVCSNDYYGNLIPYEYQGEAAAMLGMSLVGTAALIVTGAEIAAAVVGYASLYSPYVAARMNQMAPNLMARFDAMRSLGAVSLPPGYSVTSNPIPGGNTLQQLQQTGLQLAQRNGRNRVELTFGAGKIRIDLAGDPHYSKPYGVDVPTPHIQFMQPNIIQNGPNAGQIGNYSKLGDVVPADFSTLRLVDRYLQSIGK
jgi:hypothetical protein